MVPAEVRARAPAVQVGDDDRVLARPGPLRRLLYAFGRGLPSRYREWVLHDRTTRTRPARQLLRSLVQVPKVRTAETGACVVVPGTQVGYGGLRDRAIR